MVASKIGGQSPEGNAHFGSRRWGIYTKPTPGVESVIGIAVSLPKRPLRTAVIQNLPHGESLVHERLKLAAFLLGERAHGRQDF